MAGADESPGRRSDLVAAAVIGVLSTLALLLGLMAAVDGRYVGRREYDATMHSIDGRLARIEAAVGTTPAAR